MPWAFVVWGFVAWHFCRQVLLSYGAFVIWSPNEDLYKHSLACYIYSNQHILNAYEKPHHYPTRNRDLYIIYI